MKNIWYLLIFLCVNVFPQDHIELRLFDISNGSRTVIRAETVPYSDYQYQKMEYNITILGWSRNGKVFFVYQNNEYPNYCVVDLVEDKLLFQSRDTNLNSRSLADIALRFNIENNTGVIGKFPYIEDYNGNILAIDSIYTPHGDDDSMVAKRFDTVWETIAVNGALKLDIFVLQQLSPSETGFAKQAASTTIPDHLLLKNLSVDSKWFYSQDIFVKSPFENRIAIIVPQLLLQTNDPSYIFGCHLGVGFSIENFWQEIHPKYR